MQKALLRTALAITTALSLVAMHPQTVLAQDTEASGVYTKSGLEFKQSNPIPFGKLDKLIGSTFSYKPHPSDTFQMDLDIPVDKEVIVKLMTYTVNDNFVDISVDVVGFGRGRIRIDTISFASNVGKSLSFISSPHLDGKPLNYWIIKNFGVWDVNSVGGVEPYFVFTNPNNKSSIKYISLQISLFNAVGDMVSSTIGNQRIKGIQYTGPLAMEDGEDKAQWGPIWYNTTGSCVRVESMRVTWMNGKSQSYAGKALKNAMAPDLSNSCRIKQ